MRRDDAVALSRMRAACESGSARRTRITAKLTQAEVASTCRVSPKTVQLWETGQRTPSGGPALEYARLLRDLDRLREAVA
jgi:DNA-binding XRE family transcriptional regulator